MYERGRSERRHRGWRSQLPLWWVLANAASGAIVGALEEGGFQFFATLVLTGPVLGIAQWLVLRQYLQSTGRWVLASTGGWWLAISVRILLGGVLNPLAQLLWNRYGLWEVFWIDLVKEPVTLAVFGTVQWLVLQRYLWHTGLWVLASTVGGAVKGTLGSAVREVAYETVAAASIWNGQVDAMVTAAVSYGVGWAGYGVVTAVGLVWILRIHPQQ
jgi:hypothetical protein